uniref:Uncharacterized protein n=1 Tax=Glossina pallidipes TaxID=7398 RepID=A0A1A9ZSU5_GLOPL
MKLMLKELQERRISTASKRNLSRPIMKCLWHLARGSAHSMPGASDRHAEDKFTDVTWNTLRALCFIRGFIFASSISTGFARDLKLGLIDMFFVKLFCNLKASAQLLLITND